MQHKHLFTQQLVSYRQNSEIQETIRQKDAFIDQMSKDWQSLKILPLLQKKVFLLETKQICMQANS